MSAPRDRRDLLMQIVGIGLIVSGAIFGVAMVAGYFLCTGTGRADEIRIGVPRTVTITDDARRMLSGGTDRPCVEHALQIPAPDRYVVTMEARGNGEGDAFVSVWRNGAEVGFDDDGGDGLNSRLEVQLQTGAHQVRACLFAPSPESTTYELTVVQEIATPTY